MQQRVSRVLRDTRWPSNQQMCFTVPKFVWSYYSLLLLFNHTLTALIWVTDIPCFFFPCLCYHDMMIVLVHDFYSTLRILQRCTHLGRSWLSKRSAVAGSWGSHSNCDQRTYFYHRDGQDDLLVTAVTYIRHTNNVFAYISKSPSTLLVKNMNFQCSFCSSNIIQC